MSGTRRISLLILVAAVAVGVWLLADGRSNPNEPAAAASTEAPEEATTEIVQVARQDLIESRKIDATLGFGTITPLPIQAEGTVTWAPAQGDLIGHGDLVVRLDNRPVYAVIGATPLYRELRLVPSFERDEANVLVGRQTGLDVAQLQAYLLELGFDDKGRLSVDAEFGPSTDRAVKAWQQSTGHAMTGRVDASQLLFLTSEVRVEGGDPVGQPFTGVSVTSTDTILTAFTDTTARPFFPVGTSVNVPTSGGDVEATVTSSKRTFSQDGGTAQSIQITVPDTPPEQLEPVVTLTGSQTRHDDVLTLPVRALLALTGGGWAVEVPDSSATGGTRLVAVELVDVVDVTAVVTGIEEGDDVVVPR